MYDIALITVTYNKLFDSCVESARRMIDSVPLKVAYVVVDNGSTKLDVHTKVKSVVPEADVVLRRGNHGMGRSCNVASKQVDAKYYFFLNPDTDVPDPYMLKRLHDFLEAHPKVGIVAPRLVYPNGDLQMTCRRFPKWYSPLSERTSLFSAKRRAKHRAEFQMEDYLHGSRRMVDWIQGSAFMISASLYHEIGGFDDRYRLYFEDVDLCREVWNRGRPVYYLPECTMVHAYGKASSNDAGIVQGLLKNPAMRYHIHSWLKYMWKWRGRHVV